MVRGEKNILIKKGEIEPKYKQGPKQLTTALFFKDLNFTNEFPPNPRQVKKQKLHHPTSSLIHIRSNRPVWSQ